MKLTVQRVLIFFLIFLLSVGFGFGYNAVADKLERRKYPQSPAYADMIADCSQTFGVPEAVIWATVQSESNFVSSAVSGDAVGLMKITPARLEQVCRDILHEPVPDAGMLYDPATNLRVGTACLSSLYQKYGMWESVYAAWFAGQSETDGWLNDPKCLNQQGKLVKIPDAKCASFVARTAKAAEMYAKLYYGA